MKPFPPEVKNILMKLIGRGGHIYMSPFSGDKKFSIWVTPFYKKLSKSAFRFTPGPLTKWARRAGVHERYRGA